MLNHAVLALAVLGLVDSISFMIVAPSLAFYVEQLGGTQDAYGFILAIYSFASFCGKPILGRWSDAHGFFIPYMISISFSNIGGLLYAIAPAFASIQLKLVTLGRILGGLGRANSALGFAYIARALPAAERTSVTALLGGVQMIGMAIAPLFSALLVGVNFDLVGTHFDNLNSVGLVLLVINATSQVFIYFFLPELPPNNSEQDLDRNDDKKESEWSKMLRFTFTKPHIGIPFLTIFTFNFCWQFIETALAPAAADALGWSPVQVSWVLGAMAVLVFLGMASVHKLSQMGVTDFTLLCYGLLANAFGYLLLYCTWRRGVSVSAFIIPILIAAGSFAFLGAPNRSLFSKSVDATPELSGLEGTMQALLSMASSVGGFTAPSVVAHYCLRTPEMVDSSSDVREFTPFALIAPALGFLIYAAVLVAGEPELIAVNEDLESICDKENGVNGISNIIDEATPLKGDRRKSEGDSVSKSPTKLLKSRRRSLLEVSYIRGSCNVGPSNDVVIFNSVS